VGKIAIWLALVGAVIGAVGFQFGGVLTGALLGFLAGQVYSLSQRLGRAEKRLARLEREVPGDEDKAAELRSERMHAAKPAAMKPTVKGVPEQTSGESTVTPSMVTPSAEEAPRAQNERLTFELPDFPEPAGENPLITTVQRFFTDGNVVVRVGIIVLFFGVAFLLKFAAENNMLPIELRLGGAALGAIGLIGLGWHLRRRRLTYALLIQGGGIGIFYLTVYAAAKLYHLIPPGMAFVLMSAVVVLSGVLAVLQDSRNLAAFGISGGFLAPVLTATGDSGHVMLFSYYALLNAGILGIAWFKAWRELNLLGFVFTFVIASLWWGLRFYHPEYFNTVEPFLILFFLFYVAIAVLFALRQPLKLRGYVDSTLVFGVPIVGFSLQAALVREMEYGMAFSALALGAFYILLSTSLWRRRVEGIRLLSESFLALGVVFATLAIPLGLDGRWTSAAWALEGAAMVWIGIRQRRLLPRLSGQLLQFGAGVSFLLSLYHGTGAWPVLNSIYLGMVLIAFAGLFSSLMLYRHEERLRAFERPLHGVLMGWGLLWWFAAGLREIDRHVGWEDRFPATVLFISLSGGALLWLWRRLDWAVLRYPLSALLPAAALISLNVIDNSGPAHFFERWGVLAWLTLFTVQYRLLWRGEMHFSDKMLRFGHSATLWLLLLVLAWEAKWWSHWALDGQGVWALAAFALIPAFIVLQILRHGERLHWPVGRWLDTYQGEALIPVVLGLWLWSLAAVISRGDPWPLPYLPLLNPLELSQFFVVLVLAAWCWHNRERFEQWLPHPALPWYALGLAAFALLNETVAHAIHYWADVPYRIESLHRSVLFQTSISVVWTLSALLITVFATRGKRRRLWFIGAALLALVVAKLFFIDLARSGTVERIISFIAVGGLMLVIGYFSPLPPKMSEDDR
jgi:uncharacterized membrane protein